jgi:NAD(P)-dependent dehydrogenase (short-subunit alcohol dehydrogenase family)
MSKTEKVVMITGAAGNLGRAVAASFAVDGARLILVGNSLKNLRAAALPQSLDSWQFVDVDLANQDDTDARLRQTISQTGPVDVLCAIAGAFLMGEPVHETSSATWNTMMDVNVRTLLNTTRCVVPGMIERGNGRIVTIGATTALHGNARMGAYTAAKSSVMRLTESMAAELGPQGINVNCVLPSVIDTPQNRKAMPDADPKAWVNPNDLAAVIRFLASDQAIAINGALIPVTGRG